MKETTKTPWDIEGKWSVSPYGWSEEVRKEFPLMPNKILIRDDTHSPYLRMTSSLSSGKYVMVSVDEVR